MLNRRSFLGALAGLPVLGHVMQRAPLPTDTPLVTNGHPFLDWEQTLPANTFTVAHGEEVVYTFDYLAPTDPFIGTTRTAAFPATWTGYAQVVRA